MCVTCIFPRQDMIRVITVTSYLTMSFQNDDTENFFFIIVFDPAKKAPAVESWAPEEWYNGKYEYITSSLVRSKMITPPIIVNSCLNWCKIELNNIFEIFKDKQGITIYISWYIFCYLPDMWYDNSFRQTCNVIKLSFWNRTMVRISCLGFFM